MNKKTNKEPKFYAQTNGIKGTHALMHRYIMNAKKHFVIDHLNHDTTDNRKHNLRSCTQKENLANSKGYCTNKSGRRGVCKVVYKSGTEKWKAFIMVNNININLGFFDKFDDAVKVREDAEMKYNRHESQLEEILHNN